MKKTIAAALLLITTTALHADELADKIARIASTIDATVGVSAIDLATGQRVALRGDERFPMASVYKLPIAMAMLKKAPAADALDKPVTITPSEFVPGHSRLAKEAGGKPVTHPLGQLLIMALGESDNTASDAVLRTVGGPEEVTRYLRFIGVTAMDVSRSEKQIAADAKKGTEKAADERDTATPNAVALLLRQFETRTDGLGTSARRFIVDILRNSKTGEHRIRAGIPAGVEVYDKTGTANGIVNDAAVVTVPGGAHRIVMAIFTKGAKKTTEAQQEETIAAIAREIYTDFTKRR